MKSKLLYCLTLLLIISLLSACMTSSKGSLFSDTYDSANQDTESDPSSDSDAAFLEDVEEDVLHISTTPYGASIYLNNSYAGTGPLELTDMSPGSYKVTISSPGYYEETFWINYGGGSEDFYFDLEEITGYLVVSCNIPFAEISVDSRVYTSFPASIRIGSYHIKARAFGYEEYNGYAEIFENRTTELYIELEEVEFSVSYLRSSRRILNPDNPGLIGTTSIMFEVSTYGTGILTILDPAGTEVFRYTFPEFTTWEQSCRWNGKDTNGKKLDDGQYAIVIQATGSKKRETVEQRKNITIDRSYIISYRIPWSGVSGLIYAATTDVLPADSFQFSCHAFVATGLDGDGNLVLQAPLNAGLRLGMAASSEINLSFSAIIRDDEVLPFSVSGAYKYRLFSLGSYRSLSGALFARGTYVHGTNADTYTNYTGLSLGLPLSLDSGIVSIIIDPEITVSPYRVIYGSSAVQSPDLQAWLYAKLGVVVDAGPVTAALSGSLRTTPLSEGLDIDYPANGALELNMMIPGTQLFASIGAAMEFINVDNYYINYGIGLSALH